MQETQVLFLGQEDPLEKEMETHSCIIAWEIPWTEEPCGLQSMGLQRVGHDFLVHLFIQPRFFEAQYFPMYVLCVGDIMVNIQSLCLQKTEINTILNRIVVKKY